MRGRLLLRYALIVWVTLFMGQLWAKDTSLVLYRPFIKAQQSSQFIRDKKQGECLTPSKILTRSNAWQCASGSTILDPCFVLNRSNGQVVICPDNPWAHHANQLVLKQSVILPADETQDISKDYPWAIELINGSRCIHDVSQESIDNIPVRYQCNDGAQLIGHIHRCNNEWQMLRVEQGVTNEMVLTKVFY